MLSVALLLLGATIAILGGRDVLLVGSFGPRLSDCLLVPGKGATTSDLSECAFPLTKAFDWEELEPPFVLTTGSGEKSLAKEDLREKSA